MAPKQGKTVAHGFNGGNGPDGVALFWDTNKFELVDKIDQILDAKKYQNKQALGAVILRHIKTRGEITVHGSHFKSGNVSQREIKEEQMGCLAKHIVNQKREKRSIIVAGDFNCHWEGIEATPHNVLHEICTKSNVSDQTKITWEYDGVKKMDESPWSKDHGGLVDQTKKDELYRASFLKSAYREITGESWGTTAKTRLCGNQLAKVNKQPAIEVEDYIFCDEAFTAVSVWGLPYQEEIRQVVKKTYEQIMKDPVKKKNYEGIRDGNKKIHSIMDIVTTEVVRQENYLGVQLLANFKEPSDHIAIASVVRYSPPTEVFELSSRMDRITRKPKNNKFKKEPWTVFPDGSIHLAGELRRPNSTEGDTRPVIDRISKLKGQVKITLKNAKQSWDQEYFIRVNKQTKPELNRFLEYIKITLVKEDAYQRKIFNENKGKKSTRMITKEKQREKEFQRTINEIDAVIGGKRRRMAQREFSDKRDSPVMVRLLEEIVEANQKHNERQRRNELN